MLGHGHFQNAFDNSLPSMIRPSDEYKKLQSGRDFSQDFEDISAHGYVEQKSINMNQQPIQILDQKSIGSKTHSVAIGGDDEPNQVFTEVSTDVHNLVNLQNFGCNTFQI